MHVSDVSISEIDVQFPDTDQRAQLNISYCEIQFAFNMMEQIYPYIQDQGQGYLYISNILVDVIANPTVEGPTEDMCFPYQHLNANFSNDSTMYVGNVKISFDSQYSYIYNGIMSLLKDVIIDVINEQLGPEILSSALDAAVDGISGGWCTCSLNTNRTYGTSIIYQDFEVKDQMFKIKMSGQYSDVIVDDAGIENFYFKGYNNTNLQTRLLTNSDFMYYLEKQNWETGIKEGLEQKLNKTIQCLKYVNQGALMSYGNAVYIIKFQEQNNLCDQEYISIVPQVYQYYGCLIDDMSIKINDYSCQLSEQDYQAVQDFYSVNYFNIVNSYGNDHCDFMYQDDNNMLMSCYQEK